jgi:hypothetical protein
MTFETNEDKVKIRTELVILKVTENYSFFLMFAKAFTLCLSQFLV